MMLRTRDTKTQSRRIKDVGKSVGKVDGEALVRGLGAERVSSEQANHLGTPLSLMALRQETLMRLKSSGGRPGLSGASRRQKIPLQDSDWLQLEELAAELREQNVNATPGQVASMIIHMSLRIAKPEANLRKTTLFVDVDPHTGDHRSPPKVPLEEVG